VHNKPAAEAGIVDDTGLEGVLADLKGSPAGPVLLLIRSAAEGTSAGVRLGVRLLLVLRIDWQDGGELPTAKRDGLHLAAVDDVYDAGCSPGRDDAVALRAPTGHAHRRLLIRRGRYQW
jgi:hypothetical protein